MLLFYLVKSAFQKPLTMDQHTNLYLQFIADKSINPFEEGKFDCNYLNNERKEWVQRSESNINSQITFDVLNIYFFSPVNVPKTMKISYSSTSLALP